MGTTRSLWSYIHLGYDHPHGYRVASRADRKSYPITPIRYMTLLLRDQRGAASLRKRNRAEITVLMCKQKPYLVWFSCRRKRSLCQALRKYSGDVLKRAKRK